MKIELHLLQSFPPSNLNRDDTGAPKDCTFGGRRRARISSQCFKRAIRTSDTFKEALSHTIADRTKRSARKIRDRLVQHHDRDAEAADVAAEATAHGITQKKFGVDPKKKNPDPDEYNRTEVLFYVSASEIEDLAARVDAVWDEIISEVQGVQEARQTLQDLADDADKKECEKAEKALGQAQKSLKKALKKPVLEPFIKDHQEKAGSADIALFGRMLASHPALNIEATCQVAHALSVNEVAPEFDYFTAVDDLKDVREEDAGAEMIEATGFNSACYYRYHVVDANALAENLGGPKKEDRALAREAIRAFLAAAITAIPTGKQNAFAAQCPPLLVLAVVRHAGMPLSLVNAFEVPVRSNGHSICTEAAHRLDVHWSRMAKMYDGLLPNTAAPDLFLAAAEEVDANTFPNLHTANQGSVRAVLKKVDEALEAWEAEA